MKLSIDEAAIVETWNLLAPEGGHVRWAAISRTDPLRRGMLQGSYAKSPYELVEFARAYNAEGDFYVQLNPSSVLSGHRVDSDKIDEWRWFFVDLDPVFFPLIAMNAEESPVTAVDSYLGGTFVPYVVDSGRGVQLWYKLSPVRLGVHQTWKKDSKFEGGGYWFGDHPEYRITQPALTSLTYDEILILPLRKAVPIAQRFWLERIQSRLPESCGVVVDFTGSDLPRLARCPGTVNYKTGRLASFLARGQESPTLAWKLLKYTPNDRYVRATHVQDTNTTRHLGPGASWQAAIAYVNPTAAAFLSVGYAEPGRHEKAVAAARSLAEAGVEESQILAGLERGAALCRPPLDDPQYLERVAREAVKRVRPT